MEQSEYDKKNGERSDLSVGLEKMIAWTFKPFLQFWIYKRVG